MKPMTQEQRFKKLLERDPEFLAELRRITNKWYEDKYRDGPLWGTPAPGTEFEFD